MRKDPLVFMVVMFALVSVTLASAQDSDGLDRKLPKPLPEHPGNVFLAGEEVVVSLPGDWTGAWRVLDYDGRQLAEGNGPGRITLGKLPVGYSPTTFRRSFPTSTTTMRGLTSTR